MAYFPFFVDIKHKKCCVIGGGVIAYRKIEALLEFEADITVISPFFCDEIYKLADKLHLINRTYLEKDIDDAFFVIAATDQPEVNSAVSKACIDRKILINAVDEMDKCSFLFPAYVKHGDISIGVTTSGKSPVLAGQIKRNIQDMLPDYYGSLVATLGEYREFIKNKVASVETRADIFKELARLGIEQDGRITQKDVEDVILRLQNNV
jgi:uroporphyrin-III C-methyltransferase/precorrin-2 dehydrogenase/sirohydrochlorin ferrochelatase/precorrin-2 dehydrogenase/sirohydrochlorin ferrochelatase